MDLSLLARSLACTSQLPSAEGDLSENAKLWYQQVDTSILSKFYASPPVESAEAFVSRVIDVHQALKKNDRTTEGDADLKRKDEEARKEKWEELVCIMQELEKLHGWKEVDGSQYYTKDEDPSHKSNVLGKLLCMRTKLGMRLTVILLCQAKGGDLPSDSGTRPANR